MTTILTIGAGIAGLAAARELQDKGFQVTVLEGRDRIGGRIHTDRSLGVPIDLGACWIHGIKKNPIGKLAKQFNIPLLPTDYDNLKVYANDGTPIKNKHLDKAWSLFETIIENALSMAEDLDEDISMAEGIRIILQQQDLDVQQKQLLDWWIDFEIAVETGMDLDALSLWYWDEDEEFKGDDCVFSEGYDRLIQELAKNLDIKLQQKVFEVEYNNQSVTVHTNRGRFQADAAVITLPLGVLKCGEVQFWPKLLDRKSQAIARIEMSVLNKLVLKFPEIFWAKDYDAIGYINPQETDFSEFFNWARYTESPVLIAFAGGSFARSLEQLSEEEITTRVMRVLRQIYGDRIPNPEAMVMTRWNNDPFSFGSYSQIPVGAKMSDRDILAEPVGDRLFFAGEATSRHYPATVHGAFLSGIREAKRISKLFQI